MDIRYRLKFNLSDGSQIDAGEIAIPKGQDGYIPVRGKDYWTEADKEEIIQTVLECLGGNGVFGTVDEDNNIIIKGNLADGEYSIKYEMEDGSTVKIGNFALRDGEATTQIYSGSYEVTPATYAQSLETENKIMEQDLLVNSIPYDEVSNNMGGTTVTIGSEE